MVWENQSLRRLTGVFVSMSLRLSPLLSVSTSVSVSLEFSVFLTLTVSLSQTRPFLVSFTGSCFRVPLPLGVSVPFCLVPPSSLPFVHVIRCRRTRPRYLSVVLPASLSFPLEVCLGFLLCLSLTPGSFFTSFSGPLSLFFSTPASPVTPPPTVSGVSCDSTFLV